MTITLGGVTLNDHISWRGRFNSPYPGRELMTLGGRLVVQRGPTPSSDIILEAIEEDNVRKGYFLKSQLDSLEALMIAGTQIPLDYHNELIQVIIKANGINVEKTLWKSTYTAEEKYIGYIALKRVN